MGREYRKVKLYLTAYFDNDIDKVHINLKGKPHILQNAMQTTVCQNEGIFFEVD